MSMIRVNHLTFAYEGSYDNIFENVSFQIDTDWRLGFIGRNGRGKTTFLRLLMSQAGQERQERQEKQERQERQERQEELLHYQGTISASVQFTYFPYTPRNPSAQAWEVVDEMAPDYEYWKLSRELNLLELSDEVLYRPFDTLSQGERTKILMAGLFLRENSFLLIDEPTNHLDGRGRQVMADYLRRKKGFILVSHDRRFLDQCIDHVLSINRATITVEQGNFSSWEQNMQRRQAFEEAETVRLQKDIKRMEAAARRTSRWSDKVERTKNGVRQSGVKPDKGHIGAQAAALMKRTKETERKQQRAIEEKSALLKDRERADSLRLSPRAYRSPVLLAAQDLAVYYGARQVLGPLRFQIDQGQRIAVTGPNGSGKSSLLKLILAAAAGTAISVLDVLQPENMDRQGPGSAVGSNPGGNAGESDVFYTALEEPSGAASAGNSGAVQAESCSAGLCCTGTLRLGSGLEISYVPQGTDHLRGNLFDYAKTLNIDESRFLTILRKLDFERVQFEKNMETFSQGQKKKVLIAGSLCQQAHLYIWDEPLNYIDVISRMQIEDLLLGYRPTMLFVEHDAAFCERVATSIFEL